MHAVGQQTFPTSNLGWSLCQGQKLQGGQVQAPSPGAHRGAVKGLGQEWVEGGQLGAPGEKDC